LNEKSRPLVGMEAENQIERFFYMLRKMPDIKRDDMNAASKEQQWLDKWNTLTTEQKRPITDLQLLSRFGIKHEPDGRQITITNRGVEPQINGTKYSYDLPDYVNMMPLIGQKVNVIYDPYDMSRVLITNGMDIRFIAKEAVLQPRALHDATPNSRHMLNMILNEKKEQVNKAAGSAANRKIILENEFDSEAVLLSAFMPKELKNATEDHYLRNDRTSKFEADSEAFIDETVDWNKYRD
ncbi:MAG TPA: Mu transposase C-terminal domain-containing protein, partial [Segetibacter sp.]